MVFKPIFPEKMAPSKGWCCTQKPHRNFDIQEKKSCQLLKESRQHTIILSAFLWMNSYLGSVI